MPHQVAGHNPWWWSAGAQSRQDGMIVVSGGREDGQYDPLAAPDRLARRDGQPGLALARGEEQVAGRSQAALAVPGNHDLQWHNATNAAVWMLENWSEEPDIRDAFWKAPGGEYHQVIKNAFAGYDKWWRNTQHRPSGMRDYEGRLALHPKQFHEACGGDGVMWAESHHACFLMTRHPPQWLNDESRKYLYAEIIGSFCLHICGHNHETQVLQELTGGARDAPLRWLGRFILGLEKCNDGQFDRSHGNIAGELRIAASKGHLQFMPRRCEKEGGNRDLVPDHSVKLLKNDRTRSFPIPLRRVKPPPPSPLPPPGNAKDLFPGVIKAINVILDANPALREELKRAVKSDSPKLRDTAADGCRHHARHGLRRRFRETGSWRRHGRFSSDCL